LSVRNAQLYVSSYKASTSPKVTQMEQHEKVSNMILVCIPFFPCKLVWISPENYNMQKQIISHKNDSILCKSMLEFVLLEFKTASRFAVAHLGADFLLHQFWSITM